MKRLKVLIPLFIGFFIALIVLFDNKMSITDIVMCYSFQSANYYPSYIDTIMFWYIPIVMSHFLFGTDIYKHFCSASVYYFSRTNKRKHWYFLESIKMYTDIIIYLLLLLGSATGIFFLKGDLEPISGKDLFFVLYYLAIYSMYIFVTAELVNIISIISSSNIGFAIIELLCMSSFGLYSIIGDWLGEDVVMQNINIIRFNPACHLIIDIHSSQFDNVNQIIDKKNFDFALGESLISLGIATIVVLLIGSFVVQKIDIIKQKPEGQ